MADTALMSVEACAGSHWLARRLAALGHFGRIIPANFKMPFVESNASDSINAPAMAEASSPRKPSNLFDLQWQAVYHSRTMG